MEKDKKLIKLEEDSIFKPLDEMEIPKPSESIKDSFTLKLDHISTNHSINSAERSISIYLKLAVVAAIFLIGFFIGSMNNREDKLMLRNLQSQLDHNSSLLVLSMLKQTSASDRLQAANVSYTISNIDNQVIAALIHSLENDPDPNVRIKCAEALTMHMKPDSLCKVFEKALDYQNDPYMQLMLINLISSINDPESGKVLQNFINSNKADEFVRSEVKKSFNL